MSLLTSRCCAAHPKKLPLILILLGLFTVGTVGVWWCVVVCVVVCGGVWWCVVTTTHLVAQ